MALLLRNTVLVVIAVVTSLFFGWFYMRDQGLSKEYRALSHPFFGEPESNLTLIAHRGGSAERPENTFAAFDHATSLHPDIVLWADVQTTHDQELVVFHDQELGRTTNGQGSVLFTKYDDIRKLDAGYRFQDADGRFPFRDQGLHIPTLREFLERYPDHRIILNFRSYSPGLDRKIVEVLQSTDAGDRIVIHSELDGLLKDVRTLEPMWLYGTSQAQVTQLLMMSSLGLESLPDIRGDVFISDLKIGKRDLLNDRIIHEMHRRQKRLITGPVDTPESASELESRGISGVFTDRPSDLVQLL